jgi:formamidopyrimidine-DNA glycosylase
MPELPEVETVRRTLKNVIIGKKIKQINVFYDKMLLNETRESFKAKLQGKTILNISRYAKYLIFEFEDVSLVSHLRMEGKYFISLSSIPYQKHEHIIFEFEDGWSLRYHDTRKFGTMEIVSMGSEFKAKGLDTIGLEPFETEFTLTYLKDKTHRSTRSIKSALLDQKIVAGLGNIYVDEILFLSKIYPGKKCLELTDNEFLLIVENSTIVLDKAIKLGGTTIRSYTSSLGVTGRFQNDLCVHTLDGEPCKVCNTLIEKTKVGGRGTYYCPKCQRM